MGSIPEPTTTATMLPGYILKKAQSEVDMSLVLDVIWAANYDPYDPFVQLLFPILAYTPAAHVAAIVRTRDTTYCVLGG